MAESSIIKDFYASNESLDKLQKELDIEVVSTHSYKQSCFEIGKKKLETFVFK